MDQLGLDTEMADTKGFCHPAFLFLLYLGLVTDGGARKVGIGGYTAWYKLLFVYFTVDSCWLSVLNTAVCHVIPDS